MSARRVPGSRSGTRTPVPCPTPCSGRRRLLANGHQTGSAAQVTGRVALCSPRAMGLTTRTCHLWGSLCERSNSVFGSHEWFAVPMVVLQRHSMGHQVRYTLTKHEIRFEDDIVRLQRSALHSRVVPLRRRPAFNIGQYIAWLKILHGISSHQTCGDISVAAGRTWLARKAALNSRVADASSRSTKYGDSTESIT